jgi:hypothetical protein
MKSFAEYEEQKAADNLARVLVAYDIDPAYFCDNVLEYVASLNESVSLNELMAGLRGMAGQAAKGIGGAIGGMAGGIARGASKMGQAYTAAERQQQFKQAGNMITQLQNNLVSLGMDQTGLKQTFDSLAQGLQQAQGQSAQNQQSAEAAPAAAQSGQQPAAQVGQHQQTVGQQAQVGAQGQHQQTVGQWTDPSAKRVQQPLNPKHFQPQIA